MNYKTLAEINLSNISHNIHAVQQRVSPSMVIPVVKADAYGHGAVPVAKHLVKEGFNFFAVAQFQEAMELRESGITQPILIFGRLFPEEIPTAIKAGFRMTVFGTEDIRWIENAGQEQLAHVHVNLDTGMGRVGVLPDQETDFFNTLNQCKHCIWEGLYTHFSTSDEKDKTHANLQLSRFEEILSHIREKDKRPTIIHMANSGAILDLPGSYFDAVRPGIILYGHYPSSETSCSIPLKQVMTLKTFVAHIRNMPGGYPISYGRRWITQKPTTIAVIPVGYADGIRRDFTNTGEVLIQGKRYPMVGTVTMDHIMVHVGDDPIKPGDEVILWGEAYQRCLQLIEIAHKIGTIPYELTCGVSKRVKRVYV